MAVTVNVAVCPDEMVSLTGCAVIAGADCCDETVEAAPLFPQPPVIGTQMATDAEMANRATVIRTIPWRALVPVFRGPLAIAIFGFIVSLA